MEITTIASFLDYLSKIRQRTEKVIACIPAEHYDWTYKEGKFTFADIIRHLATIERYMYVENALGKPSAYPGCGKDLADGQEAVLQFFREKHKESVALFQTLTDADLNKKVKTPAGSDITLWKWLRAMVEHEIHHRGQLYIYLGILDIPTPPIFGLTSEEVRDISKS